MDWSNVLEGLGRDGDRLEVLFVSVDAERAAYRAHARWADLSRLARKPTPMVD
jgi:hypothetical protein